MTVVAEVNGQAISVCSFSTATTEYVMVFGLSYPFADKAHIFLISFYNAFTHYFPLALKFKVILEWSV